MRQTMGQIIKNLRKERGLTQDELAEKLNISPQAVSRWETEISMPDISQIVPITALFDISADILFGLHTGGAEAAVADVKKITDSPDCDNERRIELWSELLLKYPRNNQIRFYLAEALIWRKTESDFRAAAEHLEKILDESTDNSLRTESIYKLCFCYNRLGDTENAVRIAKSSGPSYVTADALLADIDGYSERNDVNQRLLSYSVQEAAWCIMRQSYSSDEDAVFAHYTAIKLLDLLYYDKNIAGASYIYITLRTELCKLLAKTKRYDEMYEQLALWLKEAVFESALPLGEHRYLTNIFMNTQTYTHDILDEPERATEYMEYHLGNAAFDGIRDTEKFQSFLRNAKKE